MTIQDLGHSDSDSYSEAYADSYAGSIEAEDGGSVAGPLVNFVGAVVSIGLIGGIGVWGYQLLVRDVTGVESHDVDDLQEVVERNQEARQQVAREAEGLLLEESRLFLEWWDSLEAVPTINRLRASLEEIRVEELTKALSRMGPDFSARERKVVEALTKGMINKILHTPVTQLRSAQQRSERQQALQVVERIFDLESGAPSQD